MVGVRVEVRMLVGHLLALAQPRLARLEGELQPLQ